jgi:hypothetical protein
MFSESCGNIRLEALAATTSEGARITHCSDYDTVWTLQGSNSSKSKRCISSAKRQDELWGLPSLLFSGYQGLFSQGGGGGGILKAKKHKGKVHPSSGHEGPEGGVEV